MPSEQMEFSDIGADSSREALNASPKKKGCWVSPKGAVGIVLLAALVATFVGLMVGFLHPDRNKTPPNAVPTTIGVVPTTTEAPAVAYRLPPDLLPYQYNLRFRPHFYDDDTEHFSFDGTVEAFFTAKAVTKQIVLHYKDLTINVPTILVQPRPVGGGGGGGASQPPLSVQGVDTDATREFFIVRMAEDLQGGNNYSVILEFTGPLKDDLAGLYYSSYLAADGQTRYLVTSQLASTDARKAFPCFDEPELKAVFNTVIERRPSVHSISNMDKINTTTLADGWEADIFAPTPPMSTYLLALIVSDFDCVDTANGDTLIQICARPTAKEQMAYAQEIAGPMQRFYEVYHEEAYPLPKMIHAAVPDFAFGAMENWGLIIYRETALLYDPASSSAANRQRVASVVAHELAHQWFGNLVTPSWWDDIWLNEGFASYMEILCTEAYYNDTWMMDGQFVAGDLQGVLELDSLTTSHPVYQPVDDPYSINTLFDDITYSKGASVLRMMHFFLGDTIFAQGISDYLHDRKYQAANHTDLFRFLTKKASEFNVSLDVDAIMNSWIRQIGYPVVTFDYDNVSGKISLSQKHFLLDPSAEPSNNAWQVPISVVDDESIDPDWDVPIVTWLNKKQGELSSRVNAKWILGNPLERFYYRVNYKQETWDALIKQLNDDHEVIKPTSRLQLIDDSFNLGRAEELDQLVALAVTKYLDREAEYTPWKAANRNFGYFSRMFQHSGSYYYFQNYVKSKVTTIYNKVGWTENLSDPHLTQRLRLLALDTACAYGSSNCSAEAAQRFSQWMDNFASHGLTATNPIDNNFRSVVYCAGVGSGGADEWNFVYSQFTRANSGAERGALMGALACTGYPYLLAEYLNRALTGPEIQRQDFQTVIVKVARNSVGRSLAWSTMRGKWDTIFEWFGGGLFTLSSIVSGVTENFSTDLELLELQTFMEEQAEKNQLGSASRAFEQALENTKANILWRQTNERKIVEWIKQEMAG